MSRIARGFDLDTAISMNRMRDDEDMIGHLAEFGNMGATKRHCRKAIGMQVPIRRQKKIVVIGAGIGGLAAAVALRQRGFAIEVYERAGKLEEVGAGLQVGPNAVKVLRALGLQDALRRNAFEPINMVSLKWDDASLRHRDPLKAVATERYGAPYMTAHRAHIHGLLCDALPEGTVRLEATCVGADTRNGSAVARFADGREVEADAVIGAGIRSAIRKQLFGADKPRFTEMMCWRAFVSVDRMPVPAQWDGPHVGKRLVEALRTLRHVSVRNGPREFGNAWPDY